MALQYIRRKLTDIQTFFAFPSPLSTRMKLALLFLPIFFALVLVQSRHTSSVPVIVRRTLVADECSNPPRDSCSFYADCLESRFHCGPTGYPIGYGQKFCEKYSEDRAELSPRGQVWMLDVMSCLQYALVPEATGQDNITCSALEDKAFGTHAACYIDSGVCTLPVTDWLAILNIVQLQTLFASWDAFKSSIQAAEGCVDFWAFLVLHGLV